MSIESVRARGRELDGVEVVVPKPVAPTRRTTNLGYAVRGWILLQIIEFERHEVSE